MVRSSYFSAQIVGPRAAVRAALADYLHAVPAYQAYLDGLKPTILALFDQNNAVELAGKVQVTVYANAYRNTEESEAGGTVFVGPVFQTFKFDIVPFYFEIVT